MVEELKAKSDPPPAKTHKPWRLEFECNWPASDEIAQTRYFWTERGARRFAANFLELWGDSKGKNRMGWTTQVFLLHKTEPPGARPLQVNTNKLNRLKPRRRD